MIDTQYSVRISILFLSFVGSEKLPIETECALCISASQFLVTVFANYIGQNFKGRSLMKVIKLYSFSEYFLNLCNLNVLKLKKLKIGIHSYIFCVFYEA